jgi:hypothetical protein
VTSASIVGADTERTAPFVAIISRQAFTAEAIGEDAVEDGVPAFEEAGA